MTDNPYVSSGIVRHKYAEEDENGCSETACGRLVTIRVSFEGFLPPLCPECYPPVWSKT